MADKKLELNTKLKLPEKTTMNLYQPVELGVKGAKSTKDVVIKWLIIAVVVLVLVFGVGLRYWNLHVLKVQTKQAQQELETASVQLKDYNKIKTKYDRYARGFMTADEKAIETRTIIIRTINDACGSLADVSSISIVNNKVSVEIVVGNLDNVADVRESLEEDENIKDVRVYTADKGSSRDSSSGSIKASLVFNYGKEISTEKEEQ